MSCDACGHDWWEHNIWKPNGSGLCAACYWDWAGPCFPWEFR